MPADAACAGGPVVRSGRAARTSAPGPAGCAQRPQHLRAELPRPRGHPARARGPQTCGSWRLGVLVLAAGDYESWGVTRGHGYLQEVLGIIRLHLEGAGVGCRFRNPTQIKKPCSQTAPRAPSLVVLAPPRYVCCSHCFHCVLFAAYTATASSALNACKFCL